MGKHRENIANLWTYKFFVIVRLMEYGAEGAEKIKVRFFSNMNMMKKMLFTYFIAIVIPFFTAGLFYAEYTNGMIERQSLEMMKSQTLNYTQNLNSRLQVYQTLTNLIANDSRFISKLELDYDNVIDALSLYHEVWTQYTVNINTWPRLRNITIYSENKTMHNSYPYFFRMDSYMNTIPQYDEILRMGSKGMWYGARHTLGREYWNPVNEGFDTGAYQTFTYNRALYSRYNLEIPIGILTIEIDITSLTELTETEGDMRIFLLDTANKLVMESSGGWQSAFERILEQDDDGSPEKLLIKGKYYYADTDTLDNGWKIVVIMPLAKAFENVEAVRRYGGILLLTISIVMIPLIIFFSAQISRRSNVLLVKMERFMSGGMLYGEPLNGRDEIGLLDEKFSSLAQELEQRIEETYVLQLQKNRFQLQMLQMQINPHFLYNTLSTIAWLSDSNPRGEIRAAVEDLAAFYRVSLSKGKDVITLHEELLGLSAYIRLQKIRYAGRINIYYDIDDLIREMQIPKLTLQPLVENSIRHGLSGERESVSVMISAQAVNGIIELKIQDDGVGIEPYILEKLLIGQVESKDGSGFGFRNINDRLKLYFGEEYGLTAQSETGKGTLVTIRLPFMQPDCEGEE